MSLGYKLSKILKLVKSDVGNERTHKAMFLANSLAYSVDLTSRNLDEAIAEYEPQLKKITSQISDHTPIDSILTQALFIKALRIRFELLKGVTDSAVLYAAIRSHSTELYSSAVETAIGNSITSNVEFNTIQTALLATLAETASE